MKFSSSFKVGLLTLIALVLLLGVVFKVKGRTFSSADRVEIEFKDVNGMRPGAGVQMMGLRVGQVEEITPVIDGENSYVKGKMMPLTLSAAPEIVNDLTYVPAEFFAEVTESATVDGTSLVVTAK